MSALKYHKFKPVGISGFKAVLYRCLHGGLSNCVTFRIAGSVISVHAQMPLKSHWILHDVCQYEKYHQLPFYSKQDICNNKFFPNLVKTESKLPPAERQM